MRTKILAHCKAGVHILCGHNISQRCACVCHADKSTPPLKGRNLPTVRNDSPASDMSGKQWRH